MRGGLSCANVIATLALFVALGGSSYAAVELSRGAVKTKHLAAGSVTSAKVRTARSGRGISGLASSRPVRRVPRARPALRVRGWPKGDQGSRGIGRHTGPDAGRELGGASAAPSYR